MSVSIEGGMTYDQIAAVEGVSKTLIVRIEKRALLKCLLWFNERGISIRDFFERMPIAHHTWRPIDVTPDDFVLANQASKRSTAKLRAKRAAAG